MSTQLRILFLEDQPLDAELAIATLSDAGFVCSWELVSDRQTFVCQLREPGYDLVLADYNLPNFDGLTALRLTREQALDIPFILVSGTVGEEVAIESLKAGATDYVMKHRLERLPLVVTRALRELADQRASVKAARQRRELEDQLAQAQKMELIGQLAGGIAHDFNNLLSVILGNVELVQLDLPESSDLQPYLADIAGAAARATQLTRQLLAFSRRQTIQPRPVRLNDTLAENLRMLRPLIGEDIDVQMRPAPDLRMVSADPVQIEQVVMNLALNARDAMPSGGRLLVRTSNVAGEGGAPAVRLSIADTGTGISEEVRPRIFEPFFTTKAEGKGTGLGLAVVYGIVQQHAGRIEVESELGRGTTFHIDLPTVPETPAAPATPDALPAPGGSEQILLAEDESMLRELVQSVLERMGYRVLLAEDGREAVRQLVAGAAPDLMLLDMVMPHLGGREVHDRARALGLTCPVIFLTGHSAEAVEQRYGVTRDMHMLQKPFRMEELRRTVRRVLDER